MRGVIQVGRASPKGAAAASYRQPSQAASGEQRAPGGRALGSRKFITIKIIINKEAITASRNMFEHKMRCNSSELSNICIIITMVTLAIDLVKNDRGVLRKRKMVEMMVNPYVACSEVSGYLKTR